MFSYTVLVIIPTCFGQSCDHLQGVAQQRYGQHVSGYIKYVKKNIPTVLSVNATERPITKYHKIF